MYSIFISIILMEIYYKGIGSCKYEGWQVQNLQCGLADWRPRRTDGAVPDWSQSSGKLPLDWGNSLFVLLRSSTDWMRSTHIMEGNLFIGSQSIWMLISSKRCLPNWHIKLAIMPWRALQNTDVQVPSPVIFFQWSNMYSEHPDV